MCTIQSTVGALATRVAVIRPGKSPTECVTVTFRCLDPPRPVADSVGDVAAHGGSANSHHGRPRSAVDGHVCRTRRESPKPFIARPGSRPVRSSGCRVAVSAAAVTPGQFRVLAARTAAVTLRRIGIPAPRVATGQRHRSLLGPDANWSNCHVTLPSGTGVSIETVVIRPFEARFARTSASWVAQGSHVTIFSLATVVDHGRTLVNIRVRAPLIRQIDLPLPPEVSPELAEAASSSAPTEWPELAEGASPPAP